MNELPQFASQNSKVNGSNNESQGIIPAGRYIFRGTPNSPSDRSYGERAAANSRRGGRTTLGAAKFRLGHQGLNSNTICSPQENKQRHLQTAFTLDLVPPLLDQLAQDKTTHSHRIVEGPRPPR